MIEKNFYNEKSGITKCINNLKVSTNENLINPLKDLYIHTYVLNLYSKFYSWCIYYYLMFTLLKYNLKFIYIIYIITYHIIINITVYNSLLLFIIYFVFADIDCLNVFSDIMSNIDFDTLNVWRWNNSDRDSRQWTYRHTPLNRNNPPPPPPPPPPHIPPTPEQQQEEEREFDRLFDYEAYVNDRNKDSLPPVSPLPESPGRAEKRTFDEYFNYDAYANDQPVTGESSRTTNQQSAGESSSSVNPVTPFIDYDIMTKPMPMSVREFEKGVTGRFDELLIENRVRKTWTFLAMFPGCTEKSRIFREMAIKILLEDEDKNTKTLTKMGVYNKPYKDWSFSYLSISKRGPFMLEVQRRAALERVTETAKLGIID